MPALTIVVNPAFNDRGRRHHDRFDAHLREAGELICRATRQPLIDSARMLLSRGCDPNARISMVWHPRPETVAMTAVIGKAAQFDVMDNRFVRRKAAAPDVQSAAEVVPLREHTEAK
jgi:hypothetical protein